MLKTFSINPVCLKYFIRKSLASVGSTFLPTIMPLSSCFGLVLNLGLMRLGVTLCFLIIFILNRSNPCWGHLNSTHRAVIFYPFSPVYDSFGGIKFYRLRSFFGI